MHCSTVSEVICHLVLPKRWFFLVIPSSFYILNVIFFFLPVIVYKFLCRSSSYATVFSNCLFSFYKFIDKSRIELIDSFKVDSLLYLPHVCTLSVLGFKYFASLIDHKFHEVFVILTCILIILRQPWLGCWWCL